MKAARPMDLPSVCLPGFARRLIEANRATLFDLSEFLFFPGMLFNRSEKWWGGGGFRAQAHEGLDLCFFSDKSGRPFRMDESIRVPSAFDGRVVQIMDDFLGRSVIVSHRDTASGRSCYLFYAHIRPDNLLTVGDRVGAGEVFAHIAPTSEHHLLPPHLHLSMAWADDLPPVDTLEWPMLNKLDRYLFLDPLSMIDVDYRMMVFDPNQDIRIRFTPAKKRASAWKNDT